MELTSPRPPAIPPRRASRDPSVPPVPTRWDLCPQHTGNKYSAICASCVKFLCKQCLMSEIYFHQKCSITYLDDNILEACQILNGSLNTKLEAMCQTLTDFHQILSRKKERMLKKRNETMAEIERYFNRLKDRLLTKLQKHENELLTVLNDKVNEQDAMICEKIQLCDRTLNDLEEKRAMMNNEARQSRRGGNPVSMLKNLVNTVEDMKNTEGIHKDIASVRDAFLVIRFFVNSENEQTILNSDIACVEVLNSRYNSQNTSSLESERINEVFNLQDRLDTPAHMESFCGSDRRTDVSPLTTNTLSNSRITSDYSNQLNSDLRVDLPSRNDESQQETTRDIVTDVNVERGLQPLEQDENNGDTDRELEISDVNSSSEQESLTLGDMDNERNDLVQLVADEQDDSVSDNIENAPNETERSDESENELQVAIQNHDAGANEIGINLSETRTVSNSDDERSEPTTSESDENRAVERSASSSQFSMRDDDPPPPYPGLPASPVQPGPNELPPPYPGGPPPPYSQTPEAQQPTQSIQHRQRLNGGSGGRNISGAASQRSFSDSELQLRLREMPIIPPTQTQTPRLSRPKVGKTFSVIEANDRRASGIFALATVMDNAFLIVDRWNKKLKYFSSTGVSFGGLIFREEPWDITEITNDLVAVTVPKLHTLYKIKVTDNSVITTSTVSTHRMYACVSYSKSTEIFVCGQVPQFGEPIIDVIGINGGEIIQSFRTSFGIDQIRLSYPRYVKVDEEGTVIVCDWNLKCLTVFKLDGSMVGVYRGTVEFPLNEPSGVTYNEYTKEIFVIDAKHNSTQGAVHKLSKDCVCKEIVRFDNEFRIARAISPYGSSYAVGNKSGIVSVFSRRQRR